jgi:hypothetical protein
LSSLFFNILFNNLFQMVLKDDYKPAIVVIDFMLSGELLTHY